MLTLELEHPQRSLTADTAEAPGVAGRYRWRLALAISSPHVAVGAQLSVEDVVRLAGFLNAWLHSVRHDL